ncbi:hypothetical protein BJX61DRAFT_545353 [Aspergillus egyptiacus]|nr:hypothetical protein BJX61DRAFT_545353 [Aspergillus egyptiacus]
MDGQAVHKSLYVYTPNEGAAIFFTAAFAVSAVFHIWQCCRYKSWGIIGLHPICAIFFAVGFGFRIYGSLNYMDTSHHALMVYILSQVFIYICPPLLELSNYHVLGRVFSYVPSHAPIPPHLVLGIFGVVMAVVETINALGVAFTANPVGTNQSLGSKLVLASLGIQLALVTSFLLIAAIFHRRCEMAHLPKRGIRTLLVTLYISMFLILIRCIYRLVENTGNTEIDFDHPEELQSLSPLLRYEWFFYVFEAAVMLLNSVLWNVHNPGRYLPRNKTVFLSQDGITEVVVDEEPRTANLGRGVLQILTCGLWGIISPEKGKKGEHMPEETVYLGVGSHQV